jgi:hypothetical protein
VKKRCGHTRANGGQCRAHAMTGLPHCFFHDSERAAERHAAQRAGGMRNKATALSPDTPDIQLKAVADVVVLLGKTLNEVRRGQLDPRLSNSVGYLSGILLRALEMDGLERRISDLEAAIKSQSQFSAFDDTSEFEFVQEAGHEQETDQED